MDATIKKLIDLARGTSNPHEAKAALDKAAKLMADAERKVSKSKKLLNPPKVKDTRNWWEKTKDAIGLNQVQIVKKVTDERVTLQIIPDMSVNSGRAVESILNVFHSMHENVMDRIWYEGACIVFKTPDFVQYRVVFEKGKITFYLIVPKMYKKQVLHSINNVWPRCAINEVELDMSRLHPSTTLCAYLELQEHFFKSTFVDSKESRPLPSLMAAGRNVIDDDLAVLDVAFVPVGKRWQARAASARNKYRKGVDVKKRPSSLLDIMFVLGDFLADTVFEKALGFLDAMFGAEPQKEDLMEIRAARQLQTPTEQKANYPGFDTVIRVASHSKQRTRAELTLNAMGTSFKDLSADNEYEIKRVNNSKQFVNRLVENKAPLLRINSNIQSIPECVQLFQLPGAQLQLEYPEIESIKRQEVQADSGLLKDKGVLLGDVTYKTKTRNIYLPVSKKYWDELCALQVYNGGMGMGKTTVVANRLVEAYRNGFSGLAIDAAKRQISEEIQRCVDRGIIPKEDFIHIKVGDIPFALDFIEATFHPKARSRLAAMLIDFLDIQQETTGQTGRFLRAAVMAMRTGKLSEILDIFEDEARLDEAIKDLPDGLNKKTLLQYKKNKGMRNQYVAPIYNRLNDILGDEYLSECMDSDNVLDFVKLTSMRKKIIVIDVPDDELISLQQDVIINLICYKLDLAMRMRAKVLGPEAEFPFFICMDEPHKYLRSANIWEKWAVEARKWRYAFCFAFHYWEQVPDKVQKAIRNGLPHFFLMPSSKLTWNMFLDEIKPFELAEALRLPKYHAISIIRVSSGNSQPMVVHLPLPPSERLSARK